MRRNPPDILITTPESLYLMLTSQAREILTGVEAVIVDEIHAVAGTKRGAHLALTLERLVALQEDGPTRSASACRATQNPLEEVGRFLVGPRRTAKIVDAGVRKDLDLKIQVPVESMVEPDAARRPTRSTRSPAARRRAARSGRRSTRRSSSSSASTARRSSSSTTAAAPSASRSASTSSPRRTSPARTTARSRARSARSSRRCSRPASCRASSRPRRSSSASTWAPSTSCSRSSRRSRSPAACSASAAPATASARRSKGRIFPKFRADLLECAVVTQAHARGADRADGRAAQRARRARPAHRRDRRVGRADDAPVDVDELFALVTRTYSYAELPRALFENVLDMLDGRYPSQEFGDLRPRIVWDRVGGTIRARKGSRQLAVTNAGHDPRPRPVHGHAARRAQGRRARRGDGLRGAAGPDVPARRVDVADRGHRPRPRHGHAGAGRAGRGAVLDAATASAGRRSSGARSARSAAGRSTRPPRCSRRDYDLDALAAKNLLDFLREQQEATRVVPSDRTIVVERFRDEIGDWRAVHPLAVRRAHALGVGARAERADPRRVRPRVRRDLVGRRDHRPPPRRRRAARRRPRRSSTPTSSRTSSSASSAAARCSARGSARTRRARCSSRAPTRASARRCGSSA